MTDTPPNGSGRAADAAPILLQSLVLPDPAICAESRLYLHRTPEVDLRLTTGELRFADGGHAGFDTYMNLFNLGTWSRAARLDGLDLRLEGSGEIAVQVELALTEESREVVYEDRVTLTPEGLDIPMGALLGVGADGFLAPQEGLLMVHLVARGEAHLTGGGWITRTDDPADVRLAISVTTFRREAEVAATAQRIGAFLDARGAGLGAEVALFIVDNGGTAEIADHPAVTKFDNPNLGGAGGFARGLTLAEDGNFTHCLFMDDDASFQTEALVRTIALLRLARSPRAAVSGAMISESRKWAMWENGSIFRGLCRPQFVGTDLRWPHPVAKMELAAARPKPHGFYAGWWFFAFPVAEVRNYPFPFFVRGDDISFSLANRFDSVTLNGVVSFQEDFSAKESPLTLYLDLRNHLHQHLVHPDLEIGAWGTTKIALRFILRSIVRMHYDSARAQLAAWDDVMKGPAFFAENADMMKRRPEITAMGKTEAWAEVAPLTGDVADPVEPGTIRSQLMKWTLNGHLVPFWRRLGRYVIVPSSHRGLIWPFWGAKAVRFYDRSGTRGYEVTHSKSRAFGILRGVIARGWRWRREYTALRDAHREGYAKMTARPFWEGLFRPETDKAATPVIEQTADLPGRAPSELSTAPRG